jgi:hypothetical protein
MISGRCSGEGYSDRPRGEEDLDPAGTDRRTGRLGPRRIAVAQGIRQPGPERQRGQFNPKVLVYDVYGPPGTTARIGYFDPDANVHSIVTPLPWTITLSTTLPTVSASLVAQADTDQIGCRVTVNGTVREEESDSGVNAQTFCLVKSA